MNAPAPGIDDASSALRSNWKFPAVVHFCRVFEGVLCLRQFSSDKFEAALLNPGDHSVFLSELISRLLYPGRKKNAQNPETWPTWEANLLKKVRANWGLTMDHDPLEGQRHFVELEILYLLTEIALQNSHTLRDTIRNTVEDPCLTADSVRCLPIGEDADGSRYFLFSLRYEDCRLYKMRRKLLEGCLDVDEPPPEWTTVTLTIDDLRQFVAGMKLSRNSAEKKMHRYLSGILPEFERTERHRKKVEERAALREQAPLLKRSSRLQEQAKRKERARGRNRMTREADGEGRQEEIGHDDSQASLDLGISREERMRLRNQRRELAEKGLRRVLTGKKRRVEYDGLTPLGPTVQCLRKKRIQDVRPSRNITKLVSIIWEKFRRPMHHRTQFESHLESCKKRRAVFLQGQAEMAARYRHQPRPLEVLPAFRESAEMDRGCAVKGVAAVRDVRSQGQEAYRSTYLHQPSALFNILQQQRPVRSGYNLGSLQMPRPLQNTADFTSQQPSIHPSLQQNLMRYVQQTRELPANFMVPTPSPGVPDTLRRQVHVSHPRPYEFHGRQHQAMVQHGRLEHQVYGPSTYHNISRNAAFPNAFNQSMTDPSFGRVSSRHMMSTGGGHRSIPLLNRLPHGYQNGYPTAVRMPSLVPSRLTPSLVQFPVVSQGSMKATWNVAMQGGTVGESLSGDVPKLPYKPMQLQPSVPSLPPNGPHAFPFDTRRQQQHQLHDNGSSSTQDPNLRFPALFLKKK